ncbi:malonyl-CoA decarboxylase [Rhodovibrionaceae bacterium A322]
MSDSNASGSFFDRALGNLNVAWKDITTSAARSVGMAFKDQKDISGEALLAMMKECLESRGGETAARARAASLGQVYLTLGHEGKVEFLNLLAREFACDQGRVDEAVQAFSIAGDDEARLAAERDLRQALVPQRLKLLTQFNALPEGVKFLVDLRSDLLPLASRDPFLKSLDQDLFDLLTSWFDTGFLDLRQITWESSAALLEKLIAYEAVHEITSWDDLRNRLDSDRRCYALFHPRMPDEPLAFVEVALVKGIASNVQVLLDKEAPAHDISEADTAIFYSISNTQKGLRAISFGDYLIKMVVKRLSQELPQIKTFSTLSPVPGFRIWLDGLASDALDDTLSVEEKGGLRALGGADDTAEALHSILKRDDWQQDEVITEALSGPLMRLAALYFQARRPNGLPLDAVARFHLRNGSRLEQINWMGDNSAKGLRQSAGIMVNYRYILADIEKNHELYTWKKEVVMGPDVKALLRQAEGGGRILSFRRKG